MDTTTPHLMTRAVPGDKRCSECGLTAGTKAHRAGRDAAAQQAPAVDQGDQVAAAATEVPAVGIGELPHVIAEQLAGWTIDEITRDVATFGQGATAAMAAGDVALATRMTVQGIRYSVAIMVRTAGAGAGRVPEIFRPAVMAALAGDQGDMPAPTRWVTRTGRPVATPSQVDIVRGNVVRAPAVEAPAGDPIPAASDNGTDLAHQVVIVPAPAGDSEGTTMQAVVKRSDLVAALAYAVKGVPTRPSVPALAGVVLTVAGDTLTAHTFDWDTFRAGDVPAVETVAGTVAVGGRTFLASVKAMKARTVTVYASAGEITVSAGPDDSVTLALMPREDMPNVPAETHIIGTMDAAAMASLAGGAAVAAGTDRTEPMMMNVRVRTHGKSIDFAATDRYRLHTAAGTWSPATDGDGYLVAPGSEYLVPGKLLSEATVLFARRAGRAPATVTITAGEHGKGGDQAYGVECNGFRMLTRTYTDAQYPPVDGLFPAAHNGTVTVSAGTLVDKISTVTAGATRKEFGNLIIVSDVAGATITLEFWNQDCDDKAAGTVTLPATFDGDVPDVVGLNPFYTADAVTSLPSGAGDQVTLSFVNAHKPMVITAEGRTDARNLVMPVRFSGRDVQRPAAPASVAPAAVPAVEVPAPAVETGESIDQGTSGSDAVSVPAVRDLIDGRDALAGALAAPAPESRAVAILPAGALAAVTTDPRPRDFDAYRDEIGMCQCSLCTECAYAAHHWCDKRDQVHAARVLLAHLVAGTHTRMTLKERAGDARAHHEWLVGQAEAAGKTGEALERVKHPDVYMRLDAKAAVRDSFVNGSGLGMTPGGIIGTPRSRAYLTEQAAKRREADALAGDQVAPAAPALAAVPAVEVPAPAAETVESGDQGDQETAGKVREMIAGATWSYGTGHIGKGRNRKAFRGPMMSPKLDGFVSREVWTVLADTVHALGGGAWMADVKAFACQSSDVGTPWSKGHRSTQERAADYLAETAPATDVPALLTDVPDVEAPAPAAEVPVTAPAAPRKRDPKRALRSLVARLAPAGTVTSADIYEATGMVTTKGARPADDQVSAIMGEPYRFVERVAGIVGHYDRFMPVTPRADVQDAPAVVSAVEAPASVDQGERADDQGTSDSDAVSVPAVGATYSAGPGHPLAVDASKPVTVTLVYTDAPAAPALAAPAVDQVPALAGDVTHGAHAQRVHVSGAGDMDGYRFHLVAGVGCRQFAKPLRRALADRFGRDAFSVTTPSGSGAVNVAAKGEVADWPAALALVAGIIGDKIAGGSAGCAVCDRSHALADH